MPPRVLTRRELNRALLARQCLLERVAQSPARVAERVGGLQTQYAPTAYLGLWSRIAGFRRDDLTRALEARRVVQGTLMRATIHVVSRRDYWPMALAVREGRRTWWSRATRGALDGVDLDGMVARVRELLAGGPRPAAEVKRSLREAGLPPEAATGFMLWVDIVRVPPSGTWERRRADLYGLAEDWVPPPSPPPTKTEALELLVRRYLAGFGPASMDDLLGWAALPAAELGPVVAGMRVRRFLDESGRELVDVPGGPLPDPETPAPPRFIGPWEALLLVQARRTGVLPEEHRPKVFSTPASFPTFLVDGAVAGTWRYEGGRVRLEPYGRLSKADRAELDDEAELLVAFHRDGSA